MARHLYFRQRSSSSPNGSITTGGTSASGVDSADESWFPRDGFIFNGSLYVATAQAAGKDYANVVQVNRLNVGSTLTITGDGSAQSVRGAHSADIPIGTGGALSTAFRSRYTTAGAPTAQPVFAGYSYECDTPDTDISVIGTGGAFNWGNGGADTFYSLTAAGIAGVASEASVQVEWPVAGVLQYFVVRYAMAINPDTFELWLRKNGVDTLQFPLVAGAGTQVMNDYSSIVTVAAGDLLNFRMKRLTGSAASAFNAWITMGFSKIT